MDQYYRILTTYRHPGVKQDDQEVREGREAREEESIIVMRRGHVS